MLVVLHSFCTVNFHFYFDYGHVFYSVFLLFSVFVIKFGGNFEREMRYLHYFVIKCNSMSVCLCLLVLVDMFGCVCGYFIEWNKLL